MYFNRTEHKEINEFGGLILSPEDKIDNRFDPKEQTILVRKYHICSACYLHIRDYMKFIRRNLLGEIY